MAATLVKKIDILRDHSRAGNWHAALRLAASWPQLGEHKVAIQQGWAALSNGRFYREIGKDPAAMVAAGQAALVARYCPQGETWNTDPPAIS